MTSRRRVGHVGWNDNSVHIRLDVFLRQLFALDLHRSVGLFFALFLCLFDVIPVSMHVRGLFFCILI